MGDFIRAAQTALTAITPHQGNRNVIVRNVRGSFQASLLVGEAGNNRGYSVPGAFGELNPDKILGEDIDPIVVTDAGLLTLGASADFFGTNPITLAIAPIGSYKLGRTSPGVYQLAEQVALYNALQPGRRYLIRITEAT